MSCLCCLGLFQRPYKNPQVIPLQTVKYSLIFLNTAQKKINIS